MGTKLVEGTVLARSHPAYTTNCRAYYSIVLRPLAMCKHAQACLKYLLNAEVMLSICLASSKLQSTVLLCYSS